MLRNRTFIHGGRALEVRTVKADGRYTAAVYEQERAAARMEYAVSIINDNAAAETDLVTYLSVTTESDFKRWSDFRLEKRAEPAFAAAGRAAAV
jgi:hypothetical protein